MSEKKIKVLTISDHPLLPSGVGTQTKYVIEALLQTGRFEVISLGGAVQHPDYTPSKTEQYGDDWVIFPVDGYSNADQVRATLLHHKPDILWFMTDPRFYEWLWTIEDEIRSLVPTVYYHVWDNYPYPSYNKRWYESTDVIATISKVTSDIVQTVSPDTEEEYVPHAVNTTIFRKMFAPQELEIVKTMREDNCKNKMVFFWNNRNARRKQSGSLIFWWKKFLDKVGHDKATLIMHTDVNDQHGQPLNYLLQQLDLTSGQVQFSTQKMPPEQLAMFYNMADCTINIADAEGFGLATLESLACETHIIVTMSGGLQAQVTDGENWFGIGIDPSSRAVIGGGNVPFICEDRINEDDFVDALVKIYEMSAEERNALGAAGRGHVMKNYNFDQFKYQWINLMENVHEKYGSWDTRKNYKSWELKEL